MTPGTVRIMQVFLPSLDAVLREILVVVPATNAVLRRPYSFTRLPVSGPAPLTLASGVDDASQCTDVEWLAQFPVPPQEVPAAGKVGTRALQLPEL